MAITKKDLEGLSEIFATKKDFENFTIKVFEIFATKEDLKNFVTKEEFRSFREETLNILDQIMKKISDLLLEQKMFNAQYRRHDDKLEDHEKRITTLEVKV